MDADALKSLGTLLLWGLFFFFMMRFGCGAHLTGGHGHHGRRRGAGETKDPVCGMAVDERSAAAASVRGGSTWYFCSTACRDKFKADPDKYVAQGGAQQQHVHGGGHG